MTLNRFVVIALWIVIAALVFVTVALSSYDRAMYGVAPVTGADAAAMIVAGMLVLFLTLRGRAGAWARAGISRLESFDVRLPGTPQQGVLAAVTALGLFQGVDLGTARECATNFLEGIVWAAFGDVLFGFLWLPYVIGIGLVAGARTIFTPASVVGFVLFTTSIVLTAADGIGIVSAAAAILGAGIIFLARAVPRPVAIAIGAIAMLAVFVVAFARTPYQGGVDCRVDM
jgi:hypothetical protein